MTGCWLCVRGLARLRQWRRLSPRPTLLLSGSRPPPEHSLLPLWTWCFLAAPLFWGGPSFPFVGSRSWSRPSAGGPKVPTHLSSLLSFLTCCRPWPHAPSVCQPSPGFLPALTSSGGSVPLPVGTGFLVSAATGKVTPPSHPGFFLSLHDTGPSANLPVVTQKPPQFCLSPVAPTQVRGIVSLVSACP